MPLMPDKHLEWWALQRVPQRAGVLQPGSMHLQRACLCEGGAFVEIRRRLHGVVLSGGARRFRVDSPAPLACVVQRRSGRSLLRVGWLFVPALYSRIHAGQ